MRWAVMDQKQNHQRSQRDSASRSRVSTSYRSMVSRLVQPDLSQMNWHFEVVFDYGEHFGNSTIESSLGWPETIHFHRLKRDLMYEHTDCVKGFSCFTTSPVSLALERIVWC